MTAIFTPSEQVLGIPFYKGTAADCYQRLHRHGGLLTAPSGPGLATVFSDQVYYQSVLASDLVIPDSGYLVLLWNTFFGGNLTRLSGLEFINYFVEAFPRECQQRLFLVNPTQSEQDANLRYLRSLGIHLTEDDCYIAPHYRQGAIVDKVLLAKLEEKRPQWVLINIGGGVQEILGAWLKKRLSYSPALLCTGAAIAFKTGKQVAIPNWADRVYLGWLFRIASDPRKYYKRYWEAVPLAKLLWVHNRTARWF